MIVTTDGGRTLFNDEKIRLNGRYPGGGEKRHQSARYGMGAVGSSTCTFPLHFFFLFHWITITYQRALRAS